MDTSEMGKELGSGDNTPAVRRTEERRSRTDLGERETPTCLLYSMRDASGGLVYAIWMLDTCPEKTIREIRLVKKFAHIHTAVNHLRQSDENHLLQSS